MRYIPNQHPHGLIFDCDGTLANTMPLHWRAWNATAQRHKLIFSEERFYNLGGVPARDILRMLAQEQGVALDHIAVSHEQEGLYLELFEQAEPIRAAGMDAVDVRTMIVPSAAF